MPATLIGAVVDDKPNFMTAAWCGIAAFRPPTLTVGIQPVRYTLKGIQEHGTFSVNVPSADLVEKVDYCGIYSGKKKDKSQLFKVFYGSLDSAPLIDECPVNLECTVKHSLDIGSHILLVGEIMETHISTQCLTDGKPDAEKIDPLIYVTALQQYRRLGDVVAKAFDAGKE
jgi:flavin reductase (DIM6/NTAB) family NADH-FMN oxidoreductase RutF